MTPTTTELRPELTPLPERIKRLPVFRGYPVPWFVAWVKDEPDFRVMNELKWTIAVKARRCWICGEKLGARLAFVLGPMCGITRTTVEPACHRECAEWSVKNCPFLTRPHMTRREDNLPEGFAAAAGMPIMRNPGVALVWVTNNFKIFPDDKLRPMLQVGSPLEIEFWAEGRKATRAEIVKSIADGLPALEELAQQEGAPAMVALAQEIKAFQQWLPNA